MKKIYFIVLFVFLAFVSCQKKEEKSENNAKTENTSSDSGSEKAEKSSDNKFVGKWEIVEAQGDMAEINKGVVYTFTEKEMSTSMAKGPYSISGDTLIVNFEGLTIPFKYVYQWEGEKLKLDVLNSGGQKFVLEKR